MRIKNREKLLTFLAIGVVALFIGNRLIFTPLVQSWQARSKRIEELTRAVNKGVLLLERERTIKGRWATMKSNALTSSASMAQDEVMKAVFRWSQDSGFGLTSAKPQKKQGDDYTTIECRVDGLGNIESLQKFLYELEKDPLALKVEDLEITARDSEGQQLSAGVRLSGLLLGTEER